jgi:anaphase-promoting complex subunit 10
MLTRVGLMSRPTTGVNAAAAEEAGAKANKGKKLLMTGHDGLSGFTSVAFKMHEGIR